MVNHPGWILVVVGVILLVLGLLWVFTPAFTWLGRLPGDIRIERPGFRFYFPLTTCILLSVLLSGILWLIRLLSR